jgi:hypothetical protein
VLGWGAKAVVDGLTEDTKNSDTLSGKANEIGEEGITKSIA